MAVSATALRRNLELKARLAAPSAALTAVLKLGAHAGGQEIQTDTYFRVPKGRLKLREIEGQPAVLIWYERPDQDSARLSSYFLVPVADAASLKAALATALGVRGSVRKRRGIYFWHNVRIHLDQVEDLGTFVEFEAVLGPQENEDTARCRLAQLGAALAITPADHIADSYADLLNL
jgi:predicted adenylyl cyclase CyaB